MHDQQTNDPSDSERHDEADRPTDSLTAPASTAAASTPETSPRRTITRPDLLSDSPGRTLWRLAIPLALGFVINAVYSWTDMYFVSRLGDAATAALGFSDQLMFVIFTFGSGFCIGTGIVIARRIGEGRRNRAQVVATQSYSFMAIYSTLLALALWGVLPSVFRLMGLEGQVLVYTRTYMFTLLLGLPANLLTFQVGTSLRSTGNTVFPMTVLIISALTNALLDPVLIFGLLGMPALGIGGAGLSTVTAQWVGAIISTYGIYSGKLGIRLYRPTVRFDWHIIKSIFSIGVPASLQGLAVSSTRVIIISLANMFGTAAAAAYTIGVKVDILVFMPVFAAGISIETLVGQSIGARRYDRVKEFRRVAIRHLALVMVGAGAAIYLSAEAIAHIFTSDPNVTELTVRYLHIAVFGYLFFSIGQTGTRSLSGAGHSLRSMLIIAGMLLLVQVPLAYILSRYTAMQVTGVFVAIALGYLLFAVVSSLAIRGDRWMLKEI